MPSAVEKEMSEDNMAISDISESNFIFDAPVIQLAGFLNERVNKARWTGNWEKIEYLRKKYDDVPAYLQKEFNKILGKIEELNAHSYQKFDAALAALRKQCLLTHDMGLGKTRIYLMAASAIDKPVLIAALPRLVNVVWAQELNTLGIHDWVILERPKASKNILKKGIKGKAENYKGLKGIGKVLLEPIKREDRRTTDVNHPAKFKLMSYSSLLPGQEKRDYVVCPECKQKHKEEKCPHLKIYVCNSNDTKIDKWCYELVEKYNQGKIDRETLESRLSKKLKSPGSWYSLTQCKEPAKGALCPVCKSEMRNIPKKIQTVDAKYIGNRSLYCNKCGYAARTWVPSITRRLKGKVNNICFDESQAIKNSQSLRSRYALSLKAAHRYLLTGTPATTEVLDDLYPQLKWLIGNKLMFPFTSKDNFSNELTAYREIDFNKLYEILDPYQIRRDTDDYGVFCDVKLPPVKERRFSIEMSSEETANYAEAHNDIRQWYNRNSGNASELDIMSKMWILRRAASVPWVDNAEIKHSTKIEALKTQINSYLMQGRKILIGTEMLDVLDAIEKEIKTIQKIDGTVPPKTADRIISLFQDTCPSCNIKLVEEFGKLICPGCEKKYDTPQVLACSRHAVREGVTLNKASVVIFTDPSWTYADMWQFWKRAHRIGANYECLDVIYMESSGTIDEEMYDTAERRKVEIKKAVNRKDVEHSEKFNIRDFATTLFSLTHEGSVARNL